MIKILLIDDSNLSRSMLKRVIGEDYTYIEAQDGVSGIEKYFLEKPDLVILDLTMPGMNGLEVLSTIKQMDPNARIIIGTADVQEFSRLQAVSMGATDFIQKPFTPQTVNEVIQRALTGVGK